MTLSMQIVLGSAMLVFCALTHVAAVAAGLPLLVKLGHKVTHLRTTVKSAALLSLAVLVIVAAHTVQIWSWAAIFYWVGALDEFAASFYFATVTYTTLGYGDVVLGDGLRIFATFAAVTGLLTFGISTALLIGLVVRLLPNGEGSDR